MSEDLKNNKELIKALGFYININGLDNEFNTPDFILAEYLYSKLLISIEELRSTLEEKNKPITRGIMIDEKTVDVFKRSTEALELMLEVAAACRDCCCSAIEEIGQHDMDVLSELYHHMVSETKDCKEGKL